MPIRTYISHFLRVNEEELGLLPPFKANNKIELSEMMEIWQYAIPASWNKKLQEQVRIQSMTTAEFIIEATEHIEGAEGDYEKVSREPTSLPRRRNFRRRSLAVPSTASSMAPTPLTIPRTAKSKARDSGGYNKGRFLQVQEQDLVA
jgi:hypothetical protein